MLDKFNLYYYYNDNRTLQLGGPLSPKPIVTGDIPAIIRNTAGVYGGNLVRYYQIVFLAPNVDHPYHNIRHMLHVLWLCWQACQFYDFEILPLRLRRNILISALFHDFNHTGLAGNDDVNIERAIAALKTHILPEDYDWFDEIRGLIEPTRFPYVVPSEELSLAAQIVRDADLCQAFSPAWLRQIIFGLAKEWGMTPLEVLQAQEPFLNSFHLQTEWARQTFPPEVIEEKIAEAKEHIDILLTDVTPIPV
jgi:hypothetical protein